MALSLHQGYRPGCIGQIATLHAHYYHPLVGFGLPFESRVARQLCDFCERYEANRDGLWLALQDDQVQGSIAIDGSHAAQDGAHLRWFITSDAIRGSGAGNLLLGAAMEFCRAQRYERVFLSTFEGLHAARHLYEKHGFRLVHQQRGAQWGAEVNEQRFELRPSWT